MISQVINRTKGRRCAAFRHVQQDFWPILLAGDAYDVGIDILAAFFQTE